MRWTRTLQTVDVHCAGEIGRVIAGGVLNVPGATMSEKLRHLNEVDGSLRRFLCSEPRSGPAGSFVLLTPATRPEAQAGMIVLQPDMAHAMSGSNAICAATALIETGMVPTAEGETTVTLDTAAGLVEARAEVRGGKAVSVTLAMPPAFLLTRGALSTAEWGEIPYEISFGGVFYALIDAAAVGLTLTPENARELGRIGCLLRDRIEAAAPPRHPLDDALNGLAYVMFRAPEPDGAVRTATTMRPGRIDRSPCGTGSNANMAARLARGEVRVGDRVVSRSVIGGEFTAHLTGATEIAGLPAACCTVTGSAWIYAMTQIGLDPSDPFPEGFHLSDAWGG